MKSILPAVAAVIFNEEGQVLLQRRRDTDKWCIICGHVEYGETVENAVIREIMEETGCRAEVVRLIGIYSGPASQTYRYPDRSVQYVTSCFEAKLKTDVDFGFTNEETTELCYFHPDKLPGDMGLLNENWLQDALNKADAPYIR